MAWVLGCSCRPTLTPGSRLGPGLTCTPPRALGRPTPRPPAQWTGVAWGPPAHHPGPRLVKGCPGSVSLRHHCLSRPECCVGTLRDTHGSPRTLLPTMPHSGQEAWAPCSHCLPPGVTGRGGSRPSHSGRGRGWAPPPGEVSARPTDTGLEAPFPSPVGGGSLLAWRDTSCPTPWVTWAGEGPTCVHRPSCLRASPVRGGRGCCSCPGAGGSRPAHRSVTPAPAP